MGKNCRPLILSKTLSLGSVPQTLARYSNPSRRRQQARPSRRARCNQWPSWARAAAQPLRRGRMRRQPRRGVGGGLGMRHSVCPTVCICAVASSSSARRHWRHSERHGDGACSSLLPCSSLFSLRYYVSLCAYCLWICLHPGGAGKRRSRILSALFLS
jgi:hypothetical protein